MSSIEVNVGNVTITISPLAELRGDTGDTGDQIWPMQDLERAVDQVKAAVAARDWRDHR